MNKKPLLNAYIENITNKFALEKSLAFEIVALAILLGKDFTEILTEVSTLEKRNGIYTGADDCGFDGVWFEDNGSTITIHLYQMKYTQKESINLKENELEKFINDAETIFSAGNPNNRAMNSRLRNAYNQYVDFTRSGRIINTQLHFVLYGDKRSTDNKNKELSDRYGVESHFELIDIEDLIRLIESYNSVNQKRKDINFTFGAAKSNISLRNDPQAILSFSIQNVKAVNFRLSVMELCELLQLEKQVNGTIDTVFSANIRGFLGYTKNLANEKIRETLESNEAEYFPFLNNGITIIADRVTLPNQPQVGQYPIAVLNPTIVNGLQTTNVIYDIYQTSPEKLEGVYVLIRLYEADDEQLVDQITDATNTQTPIDTRDKLSNKRFNELTREYFKNKQIGYIHKRGETFINQKLREFDYTISNTTAIKFWYATFFERPEVAKKDQEQILEKILFSTGFQTNEFGSLFQGKVDSPIYHQLYQATILYQLVTDRRVREEQKVETRLSDALLSADELICYGIYKLAKQRGKPNNLTTHFSEFYETITGTLENILKEEEMQSQRADRRFNLHSFLRSPKSRIELDRNCDFIETDLFELGMRLEKGE